MTNCLPIMGLSKFGKCWRLDAKMTFYGQNKIFFLIYIGSQISSGISKPIPMYLLLIINNEDEIRHKK